MFGVVDLVKKRLLVGVHIHAGDEKIFGANRHRILPLPQQCFTYDDWRLPNRHVPAAAADRTRRFWLPAQSIRARAHRRDRRAPALSRSIARPAAPPSRPRAGAAPPRARDPPIPATGRRKARPASAIAAAAPNLAPPPGSAADRRTARLRVHGAWRRFRETARGLPRCARCVRRAAGHRPPTTGYRAPQAA